MQPEKQEAPRLVTEFGINVFLHPANNLLVEVSMIALQCSLESYTGLAVSTAICSRFLQPEKQHDSNLVMVLGMVMDVRLRQFSKQLYPKYVTELGTAMAVRLLQPLYLLLVDYQYYTL